MEITMATEFQLTALNTVTDPVEGAYRRAPKPRLTLERENVRRLGDQDRTLLSYGYSLWTCDEEESFR
jgi:hypothetical protein